MENLIPLPWNFWLGLATVLTNVFFATAGLLLAKLSHGAIHKMEENQDNLAEKMEVYCQNREYLRISLRFLHFILGIFAFLCLLSWLKTSEQEPLITWFPVIIIALFYILGPEIIAFNIRQSAAWRFLTLAIPFVKIFSCLMLPLIYPLRLWHRMLQQRRHRLNKENDAVSVEDEILSLLEQDEENQTEGENLESDERRMIRGIFDLDETLVREIMTPRIDIISLPDDATLRELKALVMDSGHSRIPVFRESIDQIIGLIYAKDLIRDDLVNEQSLKQWQSLLHSPLFIPETKNVGDLLTEFQQNRSHFAIVIDEYGGTEGVVTLEDIIEEIVGEIHDEYDETQTIHTPPKLRSDGSIEIEGRSLISDLNKEFDLELPEDEDYDTISGYISGQLGRIPAPGEVIELKNARITVTKADRRRVLKAEIEKKKLLNQINKTEPQQ